MHIFALILAVSWAVPGFAQYGPPKLLGHLEDQRVKESSGVAASRRHPGSYWTHNDSGDGPYLFLFDSAGKSKGRWRLPVKRAIDWEDLAIGPGPKPGASYLYIGDIGNNQLGRKEITVYRLEEPTEGGKSGPVETLRFIYPKEPHDAEALLVHPQSGDLYVVTKSQTSDTLVFRARGPQHAGDARRLEEVAVLRFPSDSILLSLFGRMTGGSISPDGLRVVLCDYFRAVEYVLPRGVKSFDEIWKQQPVHIDLGRRGQGEAICYRLDGKAIVFTSEGRPCPVWQSERIR